MATLSGIFQGKSGSMLRACGYILLPACMVPASIVLSRAFAAPVPHHDEPPPTSAYAGDAACAQCHRKQAAVYEHTPHARDSSLASAETVHGSFEPGHNVLHTLDPDLVINMVAEPDGLYQNAVNLANPNEHLAERFEIVIGSGRHGQSYLYWDGDQLYQLPASYFTSNHEWIMSPSFPADRVFFNRPVTTRCLECHTSYFTWLPTEPNRFEKDSIVYGIHCERCHNPGADHVARERAAAQSHQSVTDAAIVNPARLDRDRQLDLCSLCHAAAVGPIRPPMTFLAGDNIRDYLSLKPVTPGETVDAHGNQVGALELSKCFSASKMTCSTCHNVHEGPGAAESYSRYCLECHEMRTCGRYDALGEKIRHRCVDCHMPIQESGKVISLTAGRTLVARFRTHQIAIYPGASATTERSLEGK
jgi:hypothetical protein